MKTSHNLSMGYKNKW